MFWGYPYFRKHPCGFKSSRGSEKNSFTVSSCAKWEDFTNTSHQPASALWVLKTTIFILQGIYGSAKVNLPCVPPKNLLLQEAFTRACRDVAEGLQRLEELLAERPFLCLGPFCCDGTFFQFTRQPWKKTWVVVSKIFYFHSEIWGRFPFWPIFFKWVGSTTNQKKGFHPKSEPPRCGDRITEADVPWTSWTFRFGSDDWGTNGSIDLMWFLRALFWWGHVFSFHVPKKKENWEKP